jgi:hypothetical protein
MMHVGLGRTHPLHVEYIHLGICLGFIQDVMTEAILSHPRIQLPQKIGIVKALGKLIWIQNDLMAKWHVRDGCEYANHEEAIIDEEGYLHGKKILVDLDSSDIEEDITTPTKAPTECPFSGMVRDMDDVKIGDKDAGKSEDEKPSSPSRIPIPTAELPPMTGK